MVTAASASSSMTASSTATTMKAAASHSVRAAGAAASHSVRAACSMDAYAAISPMESPGNTHTAWTTGDAAVVGMARSVVDAMIDVIVVVSFMSLPTTSKVPSIA